MTDMESAFPFFSPPPRLNQDHNHALTHPPPWDFASLYFTPFTGYRIHFHDASYVSASSPPAVITVTVLHHAMDSHTAWMDSVGPKEHMTGPLEEVCIRFLKIMAPYMGPQTASAVSPAPIPSTPSTSTSTAASQTLAPLSKSSTTTTTTTTNTVTVITTWPFWVHFSCVGVSRCHCGPKTFFKIYSGSSSDPNRIPKTFFHNSSPIWGFSLVLRRPCRRLTVSLPSPLFVTGIASALIRLQQLWSG